MNDIAFAFGKPFPQQIAAFRIRLQELKATAHWTDVWQEANDKAFMVAGAQKLELLADFAAAIDKAETKGTTFDEFKRDFRKAVAANDWHGWTGEKTQKGQDWRARVIYRTNLSTSYSAGRLTQLQKFKFWVYRHGASREPRADHLSWDGLILPSDHPFWKTHYPPNGWGCSCYVVGAHTFKGALRIGGKADLKLPEGWDQVNPSTLAPPGVDKGWAYAPGSSVVDTINSLTTRAVNWEYSLSTAYMRSLPDQTRDAFAQAFRRNPGLSKVIDNFAIEAASRPGSSEGVQTLGLATQKIRADLDAIGANLPQGELVDVAIPEVAVRHILGRHGNPKIEATRGQRAITLFDFALLANLIDSPDTMTSGTPGAGQPFAVEITKLFGNHRLVAVFEYQARRRRLALVTMFMKLVGASPTFTP